MVNTTPKGIKALAGDISLMLYYGEGLPSGFFINGAALCSPAVNATPEPSFRWAGNACPSTPRHKEAIWNY